MAQVILLLGFAIGSAAIIVYGTISILLVVDRISGFGISKEALDDSIDNPVDEPALD